MQVYSFVQAHNDMPMFCMGEMNEIMHPNEKHGPGRPDMRRINTLSDAVKQCGFLDLGYSGPAYTWTNKRFTSTPTFQRLGRCLANAEWCMHYPHTTVFHLPMLRSIMLLFLLYLIPEDVMLLNLSALKIGGYLKRTMMPLLKKVGLNLLIGPFIKKLNISLMTLKNGVAKNLELMSSYKESRNVFFMHNLFPLSSRL